MFRRVTRAFASMLADAVEQTHAEDLQVPGAATDFTGPSRWHRGSGMFELASFPSRKSRPFTHRLDRGRVRIFPQSTPADDGLPLPPASSV